MKKIYLSAIVSILITFIFYINSNFSQEKSKYQYVGVEKCASTCHDSVKLGSQYSVWKNSPHSKAFTILSSEKSKLYAKDANIKENPLKSTECLKCHVTGGELDASYFTDTYKKEDGITCEACHRREFITKTFLPEEKDCLRCHNDSVHPITEFNFKDRCAKIAHPKPQEKQQEK